MSERHTPVLIIGSGPAGYSAAIYAARAMLQPIMITGLQQGGQLTITSDVENYPGFAEPIQGPWLMEQMAKQAEHVGAEIIFDLVSSIDLSQRPFKATTDSGQVFFAQSVIIATGAQARWLGLPSEQTFMGGGVSACATCDGFFYRDREVVVVGGGNSAVEEALYLSHIAKKVTIIHRRQHFRAEKIMQDRLMSRENVEIIWDHKVEEILGSEPKGSIAANVNAVRLRHVKTGDEKILSTDGVFIAIGHTPAVSLFEGQLKQKNGGYLWTEPDSTATNIAGVFAAGDVADDVYRQAVTAAGRGCMAALEAERFLDGVDV